jgi:hypothetical protein
MLHHQTDKSFYRIQQTLILLFQRFDVFESSAGNCGRGQRVVEAGIQVPILCMDLFYPRITNKIS